MDGIFGEPCHFHKKQEVIHPFRTGGEEHTEHCCCFFSFKGSLIGYHVVSDEASCIHTQESR